MKYKCICYIYIYIKYDKRSYYVKIKQIHL